LNDKRIGRIIIVMQRLHEDDVIGNVVEKTLGDFRVLSFAAIAQTDEVHTYKTPFGNARVIRKQGEALHPAREPLEVLAEQKRLLGSHFFSAQYLQAPVPLEGGLVKRAWLRTYQPFEVMKPDRIVQSWDTASKMGELNDFSVGTTWAIIDKRVYLLDVVRERLELPALKRRVVDEADRWKADRVLIEDKGSGMGLLQELQASGFGKAKAILPKGDKGLRLSSVTPMIEDGRAFLPAAAAWLDDYVYELCGFPGLKHDDQVDSTSQFLAWFREEGDPGGLYHYYEQLVERERALAEDRTVQLRARAHCSHFFTIAGELVAVGSDGTIWLTEIDARAARGAGFTDLG
jgi:predicted phage terminase large subunit-like protein